MEMEFTIEERITMITRREAEEEKDRRKKP